MTEILRAMNMIVDKFVSVYAGLCKEPLARSSQVQSLVQEIKLLKPAVHITCMRFERKIYDIGRHIDRVKEELHVISGLSTADIR